MELSLKERLFLANQYEVLGKVSKADHDRKHYEMLVEVLKSGFSREYDELLLGFEREGLSQEDCQFVVDTLNLYRELRFSWENNKEVRDNVEEEKTLFKGFDLNENSNYYSYYEFLVNDRGLWQEIRELMNQGKIDGFNSHGAYPYISKLKSMISNWKEIQERRSIDNSYEELSLEEVNYILG